MCVCAQLCMKHRVCLCVHATLTCNKGLTPSGVVLSAEPSFKQQLAIESYRACTDSTCCLREETALDAPFRSQRVDTGNSGPEPTAFSTISRHKGSILQCTEPSQRLLASSHKTEAYELWEKLYTQILPVAATTTWSYAISPVSCAPG